MSDPVIVGAGMTRFARDKTSTLKSLAEAAVTAALTDAGLDAADIDLVVAGNAAAGLTTGQEMIRAQVELSGTALGGVPMLNVENACATSSSALHVATMAVRSGEYETVLVLGTEKMTSEDKTATLAAIASGADVSQLAAYTRELTGRDGPAESFFMEVYAQLARDYMERTGATPADFAQVAVKNHHHGTLNPNAQYREEVTVEQVLASRMVADPLTVMMCSPIADGGAALVVTSAERASTRRDPARAVHIRASATVSGVAGGSSPSPAERAAARAYAQAGIGPGDLHVVEVHDAAAPSELMIYEELGLCPADGGAELLRSGATALGGRVPVNPSGGLTSKGHPLGATGCGQIVELVEQLRGEAGDRQVDGARFALAENGGGYLHPDPAVCVITILEKAER
ncbi:Beta-ketoadipyl-CoA thiolase [Paraconexibacter sp. AEG42_29]|uniref:Beta-ketoadipyl-CoA thiolase n=1 Tax=Paraconexibacter sp. AEG42_29 TaxID=2997339 RepID=A0AAU7ATS1_9ACTN